MILPPAPHIIVIIAGVILYTVFIFAVRAMAAHILEIDEDDIAKGPMA